MRGILYRQVVLNKLRLVGWEVVNMRLRQGTKAVGFGVGYCLRVLVDDQGKEALIIVDDKLSNNY